MVERQSSMLAISSQTLFFRFMSTTYISYRKSLAVIFLINSHYEIVYFFQLTRLGARLRQEAASYQFFFSPHNAIAFHVLFMLH